MPLDPIAGQAAHDDVIAERRRQLKAAGVTIPKLFKELSLIAFSDQQDYLEIAEGGEIRAIPFDRMGKYYGINKSRAIRKIREKRRILSTPEQDTILDATLEYELYDKESALRYLCKLAELEPAQKNEHTGKDGAPLIPVEFTDLERATRLKRLVDLAVKRKMEGKE